MSSTGIDDADNDSKFAARQLANQLQHATARAKETPEANAARLLSDQLQHAASRANETPEETDARLLAIQNVAGHFLQVPTVSTAYVLSLLTFMLTTALLRRRLGCVCGDCAAESYIFERLRMPAVSLGHLSLLPLKLIMCLDLADDSVGWSAGEGGRPKMLEMAFPLHHNGLPGSGWLSWSLLGNVCGPAGEGDRPKMPEVWYCASLWYLDS